MDWCLGSVIKNNYYWVSAINWNYIISIKWKKRIKMGDEWMAIISYLKIILLIEMDLYEYHVLTNCIYLTLDGLNY